MQVTKKHIPIIGVIIAFFVLFFIVLTIHPSVDYRLQYPPPQTFTSSLNEIKVHCKNVGGLLDADFILTLKFVNASFSTQTSKPYTLIDDETVQLRYILHQGDRAEKIIYFTIHENVKSFSIELSLEQTKLFDLLKMNELFPTKLHYVWNEQENNFILQRAL